MTKLRCTDDITADLDMPCIHSFLTQSQLPPIHWRCIYNDYDSDMIWAAQGMLMQTSLRSGWDLMGDIYPVHINICANHCWSLVLAYQYHGSSIWCPAFGSYSKTSCHSQATDCPGTIIPMDERHQLNWSHCHKKQIAQIISRTDKKYLLVNRTVWGFPSRIDCTKREWMDGWNIFLKWCPSKTEVYSPLSESLAKFQLTLVGSLTHTFPLLERELIGGGLLWWELELDQSVSQSWAELTYRGYAYAWPMPRSWPF